MIGSTIDKYRIVAKLGEGGMGAVYVAEHVVLQRRVALKVLLPQWTQNAMIVQRFINEARAMGALDHPNIVGVMDAGQLPDGAWYIVMEHLDGGTLSRFGESQGGPLSIHVALQILCQVAAGLEAAHELDIVHRDLKPDNIFLIARPGNEHFVKLLDWGISKLGEVEGGSMTRTGMIAGTPAYMAPEQMRDLRTVDRRSDVYALGVIAYQLVTGGWLPYQRKDRPDEFAQLSMPAIHHIQMTETPLDPRQHVATLNERWANAILAAIHHDPARRPQTARQFILLLAQGTPGDAFQKDGSQIVTDYAPDLLKIGNLGETVRAIKPTTRSNSRYRFGERLGAGGMAEVFKGTQIGAEGFNRIVAAKRVLPEYANAPAFVSMLLEEARILAMLEHPNIVSILDVDRDEVGLFIAMEFVDGCDLAKLADTGRLPFSTTNFVIAETLRGLGYAHELPTASGPKGIVHRDISPQNVLLSWEGAVKVSDFGIAKARQATAATASTLIKGKPMYMSPEQATGLALDGRSDLFAVGIMLWELLTGRRLFDGTTQEVFARISNGLIPLPSTIARDVPRDLEAVTMKLLAADPAARYATAALAIADLSRCADAPRDGRGELVRLLAERFPQAVAARTSRPSMGPPRDAVPTAANRPGAATRRDDDAPSMPVGGWRPVERTTLGSAAMSKPTTGRSRSSLLIIGALLGLPVLIGATYLVAREMRESRRAAASADHSTRATEIPEAKAASLTITSEPPAAVRVDGVERGTAPVTITAERGKRVTIEATKDGYTSAAQTLTIDRDSQAVMLVLVQQPIAPDAAPGGAIPDAGIAVVPPDAREPRTATKKASKDQSQPQKKRDPVQQGSAARTFNPDEPLE